MSRVLKIVILFLAFTMEVRVHAEASSMPEGCLQQSVPPCAIHALKDGESIDAADFHVAAGKDSLWIREAKGQLRLVSGRGLITAPKGRLLTSVYGSVRMREPAQILAERGPEGLQLNVLYGEVEVRPRGGSVWDHVMAGFQVEMGPMLLGHAQMSLPQAYDFRKMVADLSELSGLSAIALKEKLSTFQPAWVKAVTLTGEELKMQVSRAIAQARSQAEQRRLRREQIERENKQLRRLFRERNDLPASS